MECPVCLEVLAAAVRCLPCGHAFHGYCIGQSLANASRSCPVCRQKVHRVVVDTPLRQILGTSIPEAVQQRAHSADVGSDLGLSDETNLPADIDAAIAGINQGNRTDPGLARSQAESAAPKMLAAVEANDVKELERLVHEEGADPSLAPVHEGVTDPPLVRAVCKSAPATARTLLKLGANPNTQDYQGRSAILVAAASGFSRLVIELVQHGANVASPDFSGRTALTAGVAVLETPAVEAIVQSRYGGAAVLEMPNGNGDTPLVLACDASRLPVIKVLLDAGADVSKATNNSSKRSPLLAAASRCPGQVVEELLRRGADANLADIDGVTPLLEATKRGSDRTVKALLDNGADMRQQNREGVSPLSVAQVNPTTPFIKKSFGLS